MLPAWGFYVVEVKTFTVENARIYGRWLGERYKRQANIIWVSGGDRIPTGREDVYRALAYGLREGDGGSHLWSKPDVAYAARLAGCAGHTRGDLLTQFKAIATSHP